MKNKIKKGDLVIRKIFLLVADAFVINLSTFIAILVRFELNFSKIDIIYLEKAQSFLWMDTLITLLIFSLFGLYKGLWKYASIKELFNIVLACSLSTGIKVILTSWMNLQQPRSVIIYSWLLLVVLVFGVRFSYRFLRYLLNETIFEKGIKKIMIIGAGDAGNMIIREIKGNPSLNSKVVCIIDDKRELHGLYISGIKIVGGRDQIISSAEKYKIDEIVIAIPSASGQEKKEIYNICKETRCLLKTIPGMYQIITDQVRFSDLKEVEIEDLLGRATVDINVQEVMSYVKNKRILITGASGSIGTELCRQVAKHKPHCLLLLDINENDMYEMQLEIEKKHPEILVKTMVTDIREKKRLDFLFKTYSPDYVFHAAAHKHVPLMELSPFEAIKNNVFGTLNLVEVADKYNTKKFIMISTDKAVKPTSVMGASKRICEMIIQSFDKKSSTEFVAVRFGNVLDSNGSVIPIFRKQIKEGGPVTVTDKEITRYFMTIPEAVSLVLQAGFYATGGEIFVLDMGEPVKIYDMAINMIKLSGKVPHEEIKIEITGLRPGEKLYEELLMDEEGIEKTPNNLIFIGRCVDFDEKVFYQTLEEFRNLSEDDTSKIKELLQRVIPSYAEDTEQEN